MIKSSLHGQWGELSAFRELCEKWVFVLFFVFLVISVIWPVERAERDVGQAFEYKVTFFTSVKLPTARIIIGFQAND